MPTLTLQSAQDNQPPTWLLTVRAHEADEQARAALEELLEPDGPRRGSLALDPGSAAARLDFELCETCPIMKWCAAPDGAIQVLLQKVGLKALTELWELTSQGAGEYHFEVLDATRHSQTPEKAYLTLRLEGEPSG